MIIKHYKQFLLTYQKLSKKRKILLGSLLLLILILIFPGILSISRQLKGENKAILKLLTPQPSVYVGTTFPLDIKLSTPHKTINAVEFTMTFNPQILEILTMSTAQSFCSFYADNSFDNIKGEVTIACGVPNPGFSGESVLVHLSMRSKTSGSPQIALIPEKTRVLANDGKGTNLIETTPTLVIPVKSTY